MLGRCHCGAIEVELPRAPAKVFECNCSLCRRLGALWAYYPPDAVRVVCAPDAGGRYVWGDRSVEFHVCRACGCVTHWTPLSDQYSIMGVNARMIDGLRPGQTAVGHLDNAGSGAFWTIECPAAKAGPDATGSGTISRADTPRPR